MGKCSVPGCESEPKWKGLCLPHYSKCRRSGWTMTPDDLAEFKPNYGKLHPDTKALVKSLNAQGLSMKQIAAHLGVSWPTVRSWRSKEYFNFVPPMLNRTCDVPGCDRDHDSHGMCNTHLQRWIRSGRKLTMEEMAAVPVEPGRGRTKFTLEKKALVVSLRDKGMSWAGVARKVGVDRDTLLKWRKRGLLWSLCKNPPLESGSARESSPLARRNRTAPGPPSRDLYPNPWSEPFRPTQAL